MWGRITRINSGFVKQACLFQTKCRLFFCMAVLLHHPTVTVGEKKDMWDRWKGQELWGLHKAVLSSLFFVFLLFFLINWWDQLFLSQGSESHKAAFKNIFPPTLSVYEQLLHVYKNDLFSMNLYLVTSRLPWTSLEVLYTQKILHCPVVPASSESQVCRVSCALSLFTTSWKHSFDWHSTQTGSQIKSVSCGWFVVRGNLCTTHMQAMGEYDTF